MNDITAIKGTSLFQIAVEHRQLYEQLLDADLDEQTFNDTLDAESWPLEQKLQNTLYARARIQGEVAMVQAELDRLAEVLGRLVKHEARLTGAMLRAMEIAKTPKIKVGTHMLAIRESNGAVNITSEADIPAEFKRMPEPAPAPQPVADKKAILAALKEGKPVPGAAMVKTKRLEIK